ncbi:MAG: LysM peptidoglycan-binding domain-containing protein [Clostridiales bacterium]|nr:LysM peptidoglycan-binding domain-containing protein [Clostridiales bacterium]
MKNRAGKHCYLILALVILIWSCSSKTPPRSAPAVSPSTPEQAKTETAVPGEEKTQPEKEPPAAAENKDVKEQTAEDSLNQEKPAYSEKEESAALLEEALSTYQDALAIWERGDQDSALQALDEAYSLILKAQIPADSPLYQGKNDLRLLIAQKIQQIYASRLVVIGDNHKTIPLAENKDVNEEIQSFQTKEKKLFEEAYMRSGYYREMILEELRKEGLPDELCWLPLIESWFKVKALSRARALGLWQFISSTGYRFGLKRDKWIDERMDPLKSTRAAVKYLAELHAFFGDWTTALAAYNCGEIRVQNVIRTQRIDYLDNFWDLYRQLPRETARFVPRFIAAVLIIKNPEKYGFELPQPYPRLQFETITVSNPFKLSALAATLGVDASEMTFLNPELRFESTPGYEYELRVPAGLANKALLALNAIPHWTPPEAQFIWHHVRRGETLSTIAQKYRTTVSSIARANGLRSVNIIRPGQVLKIPGRGVSASPQPASNPSLVPGEKVAYTIQQGDTLFSIARKFAMKLEDFLALNGLTSEATIYPGQKVLVIPRN